ncbi:MAG: tRNA (adenosine(37)-N6)-dimethylallyltransferase MiaA [Candidatus Vogelbacteria bacterium]|nr:tRNA (adenosine(37)-N6)-dimethylallyltransferase MiaA [Candidatus Vogelbacteria bacterium]
MKAPTPKILVIVGPTCSGKSALAVELALRLHGEVVSVDSRQVYRGLDIGTGKVTAEEMRGVPHHLLNVADPHTRFTVQNFQMLAYRAIDEILSRGKLPIVAGGAGFYIQSITDGLVLPSVPPNPLLRGELETQGTEELWRTLRREDAERSETIDRRNRRRLIRAIEIAYAIGKVSALKKQPHYSPIIIGLEIPQKELFLKIHARLIERINAGMIHEAELLRSEGLSYERMDSLGLEYRYLAMLLKKEISHDEFMQKLEIEIQQYAKRQMTWFKKDVRIQWFSPHDVNRIFDYAKNKLSENGSAIVSRG